MASVADMNGYIADFITYLDADNFNAAEKELIKAEAHLLTLPDTDQATWKSQIDSLWRHLQAVRSRTDATTGALLHAALRRKTRSEQS